MPHGFDVYRVFLSAPGDLEADRQACHDVIAEVNEALAMPEKILLAAVGLRENGQIEAFRSAVSDNVRWSSYFIQIFEDDWGPRNLFRKLYLLAEECRANAEMPMRELVICLKDAPHETEAEILAFRRELEEREGVRVIRYQSADGMKSPLADALKEWTRALIAEKNAAATVPA